MSLSEALDRSLALLKAEQATIEECLERYPEHADNLRPLLALALDVSRLPTPRASAASFAAGERQMLAALAEGTSEFIGIERARIKESNRVAAVRDGLEAMGVTVTEDRGRITITGLATMLPSEDEDEEEDEEGEAGDEEAKDTTLPEKEAVVINSRKDHRVAMAFGVLGAASGGIVIDDAECVSKTFPNYWDVMKNVGVRLKTGAE